MDLPLFGRIVWRFKWIAVIGLVLATLLAVFSTATVSFAGGPHLAYRTPTVYEADTLVLVTQKGFPWGRAVLPLGGPGYADPSRLALLAQLYATFVSSDAIQTQILHRGGSERVSARAMQSNQSTGSLPYIIVSGFATSPADAVHASFAGTAALKRFVESQQNAAGIAPVDRAVLRTIQDPLTVSIAVPHKKTTPIVVFMTVILATLGLILALENLRPRVRLVERARGAADPPPDAIRSVV